MTLPREDFIELAGDRSPGVVRSITGLTSPRKWDEQAGYGLSTGIKFTSIGLAKFEVTIDLWNDAEYQAWERFAKTRLAKPPANTRPVSMAIKHPMVNAPPHSITQVVVEDVVAPVQNDQGLWTAVIKFIEYKPVRPVASPKPLEGPPGAPDAAREANDGLDRERAIITSQSANINSRLARPE